MSFNENWDGIVRKNRINEEITPGKMKKIADIVKKYLMPINSMKDTAKVGNFVRLSKAWKEMDTILRPVDMDDEDAQSQMRKAGVAAKHIKMLENMYSWVAYEVSPADNMKMYRFQNLKPQDINGLWLDWKYTWNIK